jgi:hypothetical protein
MHCEFMFNRTKTASGEALETRREIHHELSERLRELPVTPIDWSAFDVRAAFGAGASLDLRLVQMSRQICSSPVRSGELRSLWHECVMTAAFAVQLAPRLGGDTDASAIAGLLHRLGDLLTIRAIGSMEYASQVRVDSRSKSELCLEHGDEQLGRVLRAWRVPARAAATATEWRRLREFPGAAADATTVYLARLFAIELISPQFCAPGMLELAVEEAGFDLNRLSDVRSDAGIRALLAGWTALPAWE